MKQVIYVDILLAINLFVNYFLLLATAKFLCLKWKTFRLILGEILGMAYSLYIFIPQPNSFVSALIKLFMSFTIIWAVFEFKNFKIFFKTLLCFYSVNFAFSGIMFALWFTFKPEGMTINNGVTYFNISPVVLIAFTLISYIVLELIGRITGGKILNNHKCEIGIRFRDKYMILEGKIDTCNSLREPFSNLPVIVTSKNALIRILPSDIVLNPSDITAVDENILKKINLKFRMVPFKTVSGEGLLPAFKPDFINTPKGIRKEAYIAICSDNILSQETTALINPDILD